MIQQLDSSNHYSGYSKRLSDKINISIDKMLQLHDLHQSRMRKFIQQLVSSQDMQDWIVIECLVESNAMKTRSRLQMKFLSIIEQLQFLQEQTYVMRIYLYGLMKSYNTRFVHDKVARQLKMFAQQGKLFMFSSWLMQTSSVKQKTQTVNMLCKYYPVLVYMQSMIIKLPEVQFIIYIVTHLELSSVEQFQQLQKLLSLLKMFRIPFSINSKQNPLYLTSTQRIDRQQHLIIKLTLDALTASKSSNGNAMWLFKQGMISQSSIKSFVSLHGQQCILLNYSQQQIANIFNKLFSYNLQPNTLVLFEQLSLLLKETENYYILKTLYRLVLLPVIVYRGKAKLNLQRKVLSIAAFYIIGFYQHCDIGPNGFYCILANLNKLQNKDVRRKYIQLIFLLAEKDMDQYCQIVYQSLNSQQISNNQLKEIDRFKGFDHFIPNQIWEIIVRNARKLKHYPKNVSHLWKGIQNRHLQCYIISVMQALFTTKALEKIMSEFHYPKFNSFSYHLKELFRTLKSKDAKHFITVDQVKEYGPEQFAFDNQQQDAQQYLSKVLQKIQEELTKSAQHLLLQQFNKTFKFKISRKLECQNCHYIIDKSQQQFIHTLTNKTSLREKQVEQIDDYQCQKCQMKKFLNRITLQPTSKILIVHINRFSFTNGKSCKELATQPIRRNFMNYKLKGMIFHIGKIVECGHYVYYFNQGGKKWVKMDDQTVNQFEVQSEDEEFEREMRVQNTPYILFYVRE